MVLLHTVLTLCHARDTTEDVRHVYLKGLHRKTMEKSRNGIEKHIVCQHILRSLFTFFVELSPNLRHDAITLNIAKQRTTSR